ncbi:hypothetical protein RND81_14G184400 [Saponaria officinalis]|uniref:HAT C-terminal dimerisation domain-containing protein n=1 Tax=Saponaria officinalis TaxID=3572 RepID=A0AAW1GRQ9_SAPOF
MADTEEKMGEHVPKSNEYKVQSYYSIQNRNFINFIHKDMSFFVHDDNVIQSLAKSTNFDEDLYKAVTYENHANTYVTPEFGKISRKILGQKIVEIYCDLKKDLKDLFLKFNGNVGITCDLWSSFGGECHYVCIICHWITGNICMEKRVIGFEILHPYDHVDVALKLIQVLDEFDLKAKVGWISFDDCISKEKCMVHLGNVFDFGVSEMFSHDRTYAHVVELCAQQIVDEFALFLRPIRELVKWFRFLPGKRDKYRTLCRKAGLKPRKFYLDLVKDWKSTLCHLRVTYNYKDVLTKLYNDCANRFPVTDSQWDAVNSIISLLGKFDQISDKFRWAYDAGCHLIIQDCITIARTLRIYESDPRFCSVITNIRSTWLEVFPEIPTIYCVAKILDPRIKVDGLRQLLVYYYEILGVNYNVDGKVAMSENALRQLHAHYSPSRNIETKTTSTSGEGNMEFNVIRNVVKRKRDEIGEYLFYRFDITDEDDDDDEYFEILQWWEKQMFALPVLSKIAKEVLCIPVAATIPKSKCCPGKRVLDEKRSMLTRSLIRVCICKKDWDLAEAGEQGQEDDCADDVFVSSDSEADY